MIQKKKFKQTHNFNIYTLFWLIILVIVIILGLNLQLNRKYIGIVENKSHLISAGESGKIQNVLVSIGDRVNKDQVLAMLDISDLKTNLDQLKQELVSIQKYENAHQDRYSIEVRRMALQLENEASDLIERLSMIESRSAELASLNAEIERLKKAESAGLGYSSDLSDFTIQRDALATYLQVQSKDMDTQRQQLEMTRQSRQILEHADIYGMTQSMSLEQMEYAEELRRLVAETEYRINLRTLIAPCDGFVTELYAQAGDVVDAFIPIFTIEETSPSYLDVYIPERSPLVPEIGMKVQIHSSRTRGYKATGIVSFVHPGFAMATERLALQGQFIYARKVRVELPEQHQFIPGELVTARVFKKVRNTDFLEMNAQASARNDTLHESKNAIHPPLAAMTVPDALWKKTRFEPSGVTWLEDRGKYLIVSDDTGIRDSPNDHVACLFLMDEDGEVDSNLVLLQGIDIVNDLEAIAPLDDRTFYLISSQNISKKGKRPGSRESIIKIKHSGADLIVQGKVQLLSLLLETYSRDELKALGLDTFESDGKPLLNIEGAAFRDNELYLGLKEPVSDRGAIIWKLNDIDAVFAMQKLAPNQLSVYGYVPLGRTKNEKSGISDLMFDQNGMLWALSNIVDLDDDKPVGGFHRIHRFADGRLKAERIFSFPDLKPEGICRQDDNRFLIVFDEDNENPAYCYVNVKGL